MLRRGRLGGSAHPTANVYYDRSLWDALAPFDGECFAGDVLLSWRAHRYGIELYFDGEAIVDHEGGMRFGGFIRQRLGRGREFGSARIEHERWSRRQPAGLGVPILVLLVLARAGRDAWLSGWTLDYIMTLPVQAAGHLAWSIGEAWAACHHLRRGASS